MNDQETVWLTKLDNVFFVKYHDIYSVNSQKYDFAKHWRVLRFFEQTEDPQLIALKKQFHEDMLALENSNHDYRKSHYLPDSLWVEEADKELPAADECLFVINNGGILFNPATAAILQRFRLGENRLIPLPVYSLKTGALCCDERFYFLYLCERRRYIRDPIVDDKFESFITFEQTKIYTYHGELKNKQLLVDRSVLECELDLWYDPLITRYVFISDALHDALVQAGVDRQLPMVSCQLV